jgi:hypothetical protein
MLDDGRVANILADALRKLGMESVREPLEAELAYIEMHFVQTLTRQEMIHAIRREQEQIMRAVAEQRFEDATSRREAREKLHEQLYEDCIK